MKKILLKCLLLTVILIVVLVVVLIGGVTITHAAMTSHTVRQPPVQPLDKIVAIVNDGVITTNELMDQVNLIRNQLAQQHVQLPPLAVMRQQVLQHMIDVEIQLQLAKRVGIVVDSNDVADSINGIAKRNNITLDQLRKMIEEHGVSWDKYRDNVKKEITISKVQQQAVGHQVTITEAQVNDYLKNNPQGSRDNVTNMEFYVKDILIPLPEAPAASQIQAAKVKADRILQQLRHGADFSKIAVAESGSASALQGGDLGYRKLAALPEVFAVKVVTMKQGEVAGPIRTPNGFHLIKLVATKGAVLERHVTLTHVQHILLKVDAANPPVLVKEKLEKIRNQLQQGQDFAVLAEKNSQDPVSAAKGGELGWVHPGEVVPAFEEAMDKLKSGEISQPVNTQFGWHLIKVTGRKQIDDTIAYRQQQVRQMLYQRKFSELVQNWLQEMRGRAYIKIDSNK